MRYQHLCSKGGIMAGAGTPAYDEEDCDEETGE